MKKQNDFVAMLLVRCLLEQIAKLKGMQTCLRSNYKLNSRYFQQDHASKTDLNHTMRMVLGMANEMSKQDFLNFWMRLGENLYALYTTFGAFLLKKTD